MEQQRRPFILLAMVAFFVLASPAAATQSEPQEFDDITDIVASLRGLEPLQPIIVTPKTREQLAIELREDLMEDFPEDEQYADERELLAFGLMDEHLDLGDLFLDLYSEQVAGYYDPATTEMVVVREATDGEGFTPTQEVTYAHEVVHALQDQHFDLDAGKFERENLSDDHSLATTALIEGDASFSELQYLIDHPELLGSFLEEIESMEFESEVLDSAPAIISETLLFPYDHGFTFVDAIHADGGWAAVNAAFEDPPTSTEQILHPEKYLDGESPVTVEVPDFTSDLEGDWTIFDTNTFGEFQLRVMFGITSMSEQQILVATEGWGGDTYLVAGTETQDAIHWASVWDTDQDASEFARALTLRETERWDVTPTYLSDSTAQFSTDSVSAQVILDGDTVTYVMAPNENIVETILASEGPAAVPGATPVG